MAPRSEALKPSAVLAARVKLTHRVVRAATARPFRIATGTTTEIQVVVCEIEHNGVKGLGEAAPSRRVTGETIESVQAFLDRLTPYVDSLEPEDWGGFLQHVRTVHPDEPSALCALDLGLHDLIGKLAGEPARALHDLPDGRLETCMTVSLGEPRAMADEAREYRERGFRAIKLKLGDAERDVERVRAVREAVPDARLRADANTGWGFDEARRILPALADAGVEFVEQPFRPRDDDRLAELSRDAPVLLYADESVKDAADVERLHGLGFKGGVNLKLMKTGGLLPAVEALRLARERGMPVQLGCNVETGIGIAGGTQLLGALDHADLDGNLLLAEDPFHGPRPKDGWLDTPAGAGLGLSKSRT